MKQTLNELLVDAQNKLEAQLEEAKASCAESRSYGTTNIRHCYDLGYLDGLKRAKALFSL